MPLLDISLVTQALLTLLQENVTKSPAWSTVNTLQTSPQPPDKLRGDWTIGLYLYHVREEAHTKAQNWPVDDEAPLRYCPMGLALHYLLTAHSDLADASQQIFAEQLMMGLAVKTLHDFPKLDDTTTVTNLANVQVPILPPALKGLDNRFRILLQPIQFNEAMQYWTAGTQALRLAAYYEVAATLLEPEAIPSRRGRVLTYGVHSFARGTPRLDGSRTRIQFLVPGDSVPRELELQPAEVTYGGTVTLFGADLRGDVTTLVLDNRRFAAPVEVDPVAWSVAATTSTVTAVIQQTAGPETVLPGLYGATVKVAATRRMPDGTTRRFELRSNQTPFAVAPQVTAIVPGPVWAVTGARFDPAVLTGDAIQLFLGADRLARVAVGPVAAGQFLVTTNTTLQFLPPAALAPGTVVPFRLLVNGVESAPRWITIP
jgi:hypothetical protein